MWECVGLCVGGWGSECMSECKSEGLCERSVR